jgi:hypothetical protein
MIGIRHFDEAIGNGERNREAMTLIRNWCANAKIRAEAVGMLAQHTGLPIGPHSIECDFATDGTTSHFYELRDGAVDFHDRNCVGCDKRKGGRLPNLTELVAARDRAQERQEAEALKGAAAAQTALAIRDAQRLELKSGLAPVAQTLVDDIGAFDRHPSRENLDRLMRSAEMAPEHFSAPLVEYILGVCETGTWLDEPGLRMLVAVKADPVRLAAVAARVLAGGHNDALAASVLTPLVTHLDAEQAHSATPGAMNLANPDRRFSLGRSESASDPTLLHALYEHHPASVDGAVERLLGTRRVHGAELAGRGLVALLTEHPAVATRHARSLIATYVRAHLLLDDHDEFNNSLNAVAVATVGAFDADPNGVDKLLQEYAEGASEQARARVHELYGRALRPRRDGVLPVGSERVRIAFRRLLWATTGAFNRELMQTAISTFRDGNRHLEDVAKLEIDALLGAPFLLADRLDALEATPLDPANPLAAMERVSHRSAIRAVMKGMLDLAARAGSTDASLLPRLSAFLEAIPDDRNELRAVAIKQFARLAGDVAGLQFYLPHLYRAMVGPSSVERAGAASAVGELRQNALENVPLLLFEAFGLLLRDCYVIVHKAAARAFRSSVIPEQFRSDALWAIYQLVRHYRTTSGEDDFVAECVRTLAASAEEFGEQATAMRRYLIDVCMDVDPLYLRSNIRGLSHTLGTEPGFVRVVIRMLPTMIDRYNRNDEAEALVRRLGSAAIRAHEREFEALGVQLAGFEQWMTLVVIDALARSGAGDAASRVAQARIAALEDIPRNRGTRLFARMVSLAFEFEQAVASGNDPALERTVAEWTQVETAMREQREDQRERDNRSRLPFAH